MAPLAIVIAVGLLGLAGLLNKPLTPLALLVACLVAILYGLLLSSPPHRRVVLYEDGIEVLGWFSARKLKHNEILGRRMGGMNPRNVYGSFYIIVPKDKTARELRLPRSLDVDKDFFHGWREFLA
jgi:hypothetical protein